jgi:glycosyltransferase involved in cell wall biosynthesis
VSRSGEDGLLIPVRDSVALANAVRQLDDDRKLCRRLGLAARDKAMNEFDENIVISKTLRVYGELLDSMRQAVGVGKRSERRV